MSTLQIILLIVIILPFGILFLPKDCNRYRKLTVLLSGLSHYDTPSIIERNVKYIPKHYKINGKKIKASDREIGIVHDTCLSAYDIKQTDIVFWKDCRYSSLYMFEYNIGDFVIVTLPEVVDNHNPFYKNRNIFQGKYIRKLIGLYEKALSPEDDDKALKSFIANVINKFREYNVRNNISDKTYILSMIQQYNELCKTRPDVTEFAFLYTSNMFNVIPVSDIVGIVEYVHH